MATITQPFYSVNSLLITQSKQNMILLRTFSEQSLDRLSWTGMKGKWLKKPKTIVNVVNGHLFCKQCLHDLQFMKRRSSSPNISELARAGISCQFMKTRSLCRHCLQNEWTLAKNDYLLEPSARGF